MKNICKELEQKIKSDETIIACGVGAGLSARGAVLGGADLILTYNTAVYRILGLNSALAFLPYDNCNTLTFDTFPQIKAQSGGVPVLIGLGAHDPRMPIDYLISKALELGADGISNEPFIGMYQGDLKKQLDEAGWGFDKEVELIEKANKADLLTLAYVFDEHEARLMVEAGASIIGIMTGGVTSGGEAGGVESLDLDDTVSIVNSLTQVIKSINAEIPILIHGGPLNSVESVKYVLGKTNANGYITGSTAERIPIEHSVSKAVKEYKNI